MNLLWLLLESRARLLCLFLLNLYLSKTEFNSRVVECVITSRFCFRISMSISFWKRLFCRLMAFCTAECSFSKRLCFYIGPLVSEDFVVVGRGLEALLLRIWFKDGILSILAKFKTTGTLLDTELRKNFYLLPERPSVICFSEKSAYSVSDWGWPRVVVSLPRKGSLRICCNFYWYSWLSYDRLSGVIGFWFDELVIYCIIIIGCIPFGLLKRFSGKSEFKLLAIELSMLFEIRKVDGIRRLENKSF
jgi:hypothetical protein